MFIVILLILLTSPGCSLLELIPQEQECKFQAYVVSELEDYISNRFRERNSVRTVILPVDVPENFSALANPPQSLSLQLATSLQRELLTSQIFPILEVIDRGSWVGKRDEFFIGNYRAIQIAKNAGYDLLIVSQLDSVNNARDASLMLKVIDLQNRVTIWYGKSTVFQDQSPAEMVASITKKGSKKPSDMPLTHLFQGLSKCTVSNMKLGAKQ